MPSSSALATACTGIRELRSSPEAAKMHRLRLIPDVNFLHSTDFFTVLVQYSAAFGVLRLLLDLTVEVFRMLGLGAPLRSHGAGVIVRVTIIHHKHPVQIHLQADEVAGGTPVCDVAVGPDQEQGGLLRPVAVL